MSSMWGNKIKISIFGESHGKAIGVTIDGLPAGEILDFDYIASFMARRAPGKQIGSTPRKEADIPEILSGVMDGTITGAPLTAVIYNSNQHSSDYSDLESIPRPGHADYAADVRYNGANDIRGGGHFSGRLTAPLTFAGAICSNILKTQGITVGAHIYSVKDALDTPFDPVNIDESVLNEVSQRDFPVADTKKGEQMKEIIASARADLDSVGGIIECAVLGLPAGIGDHMFDGVENRISSIMFGVPAVKGIEFGAGFNAAKLYGSENNDCFCEVDGEIKTRTNNAGGILGGMTNGMPVVFRVAVKPTPSISKAQKTLNFDTLEEVELKIKGRHDSCILPRAVPVIEAAAAIAILDMLI